MKNNQPQPQPQPPEPLSPIWCVRLADVLKGGAGSGNFGHQGRPGERGGSAGGGGAGAGAGGKRVDPVIDDPDFGFTAWAVNPGENFHFTSGKLGKGVVTPGGKLLYAEASADDIEGMTHDDVAMAINDDGEPSGSIRLGWEDNQVVIPEYQTQSDIRKAAGALLEMGVPADTQLRHDLRPTTKPTHPVASLEEWAKG